jgi:TolB-like protein
MDVLVCLARREGQVASKDEIFKEVWPGTFVSDDALVRCMGELRHAFDENAASAATLQTIPKRGYRVVLPVLWVKSDIAAGGREVCEAPASVPETENAGEQALPLLPGVWRRPYVIAAAVVVVAVGILLAVDSGRLYRVWRTRARVPVIASVAVLPLANLSSDPAQEYFADGMTDELITQLAQISSWKVISRTSVMRYKGTKKSLPEIARDLSVSAVIEGTVLRSAGRVRITVQLIDAATDHHLWSRSFERDLQDVLLLQSDIARAIVADLNVAVSPRERARLNRARAVVPEAYEAYLKGWHFFNRDQFVKAAMQFEEATFKDPGFALGYALLAEADGMMTFLRDEPPSARALNALERARRLDDSLAEVHAGLGDVLSTSNFDFAAGEAEYRRAVELDRGSVDAALHYALCLHALRRWAAAIEENKRCIRLDPVSPRTHRQLLRLYADTHQYDLAIQQFQKVVDLDPNVSTAWSEVASVYEALGRERDAIAAYLKADSLSGKKAEMVQELETASRVNGLRGYWTKRLEQLERMAKQSSVSPLDFAGIYVRLGRRDDAIRFLERAWAERRPRLMWVPARAVWDPLRSDPRFQSLLRRMRFPEPQR